MQNVMAKLAHSGLYWQESDKVEVFGNIMDLMPTGHMELTVVSSEGTAKASVVPTSLCDYLSQLDTSITTQRALWELQQFRYSYGCKVAEFDPREYPDHYVE
jgi:hypothetical protein